MRKLLMTAAASAMVIPLGACAERSAETDAEKTRSAESQAEAQTENEAAIEAAEAAAAQNTYGVDPYTDYAIQETADIYLSATSLSVRELLGEGIHGSGGDRIARIDDLVIDANGRIENVVFLSGGFFGLGGKRGALDYDALEITRGSDYEPIVNVSLSEAGIDAAVDFETTEADDYSLASEIIGAAVGLTATSADDDSEAVVNDIILAENGTIEHLIVQESLVGGVGAGDKHAVDYAKLTVAEGDGGGLVLDMTETELKAAPTFAARRVNVGDESAIDKARESVEDIKGDAREEID